MKNAHYILQNLSELDLTTLAHEIAAHMEVDTCLLLDGPLGAGKTTFSRALIQSLTSEETRVPSPTFTILQTYETLKGPLWHLDLYRIKAKEELYEIGFPPDQATIVIVEWPDRLGSYTPAKSVVVTFSVTEEKNRTLEFHIPESSLPAWGWLKALANHESA